MTFWGEMRECLAHAAFPGAIEAAAKIVRQASRIMFIGNGGSAAIASHCAADWQKNGGFTTLAFNDPAMLTCLSNDLGYERVFAEQIRQHWEPDDLLIAISSSGESPNILRAAQLAPRRITLTGFSGENSLRCLDRSGINFYIPSHNYGVVETLHLGILHAILEERNAHKS